MGKSRSQRSHGNLHPKAYEIMPRSQNCPRVLDVDGHRVKLPKQGAAVVYDKGLAHALEQKYGLGTLNRKRRGSNDVWVGEVDNDHLHNPKTSGHCYTFTVVALPWHKGKKHKFGVGVVK